MKRAPKGIPAGGEFAVDARPESDVELAAAPALIDWHDFYTDPCPGRDGKERVKEACGRCRGTGYYGGQTHFLDGNGRPYCFDCKGAGYSSRLVSSARQTARNHAKARAERENTAARISFNLLRLSEDEPEFMADVDDLVNQDDPPGEIWRLRNETLADGVISDAARSTVEHLTAVKRAEAERLATIPDVPTGETVITGTLLSSKWQDSDYGPVRKMLVEDDRGFRIWSTFPAKLSDQIDEAIKTEGEEEHGRKVRFTMTAQTEPSPGDSKFGFAKRPKKISYLGRAERE